MRILLVGDDANLSAELLEYIADLGDEWHVQSVADGNAAIATVASSTVDAVIVAPSRWMADRAAGSAILGGCRIEAIPNPVETDIFAPQGCRHPGPIRTSPFSSPGQLGGAGTRTRPS